MNFKLRRDDVRVIVHAQGVASQPMNELASVLGGRPHQSKNHGKERDYPIDYVRTGNLRGFYCRSKNTVMPIRVITGEDAQKYLYSE